MEKTEIVMDYEKKYNEALERAQKTTRAGGDVAKEIVQNIFPELAESEDERIRKDLITYLKSVQGETLDLTISVPKWIAYLEKQKVIAAIPDELVECYKNLCEISQDILINSEEDKQIDEITHDVRSLLDYPIKQKPVEWKPQPESLEALMYAIEGKWDMISPTSYLSRRLGDLYDGLVNTYNVDEPPLAELPKTAYTANDIEELRALKDKIDASMEQKPEERFEEAREKYQVEWSKEDEMETINVFRPLAGTSIESAAKQAVNKFTNSGKKFLLAFNGVFILIDNTKSVQDIVNEYNRSLGGKKEEQGQSEREPNDFEITLNYCMLVAQQYPPGKIGWDNVKMWAEELLNYYPQPNQRWSEFDGHCLERAIWYVENPAPSVVKDTNLALWLKSLPERFVLQPKQEWGEEDNIGWDEAFACVTRAEKAAKNEEELQNAVTAEKWLKKIKFKYCAHPVKQEWSDEDERIKSCICLALTDVNEQRFKGFGTTLKDCLAWVKDLHPSWKPSEEQMEALERTIRLANFGSEENRRKALESLHDQLEKLTQEG